jgi:hypothetical protein
MSAEATRAPLTAADTRIHITRRTGAAMTGRPTSQSDLKGSLVSNRQLYLGIVGALLLVIGLLALWFPVYLSQYDQYGIQIACGRGFSSDMSQAAGADGNALVAQCGTALLLRRLWAIPAAVLGWLMLVALLAVWAHTKPSAEDSSRFWELRGDST